MRKAAALLFTLFILGSGANAQIPTAGNVFFGYSYYNTNVSSIDRANTNGWEGSFESKVFPWVGIVADLSGHYGSQNFPASCPVTPGPCAIHANFNEHNVLFGPRISASVGKLRPFAEVLIGVGHLSVQHAFSDTSFATGIGGGIDYRLIRPIAWRFQGDYIQTRFSGTTQNNVRLSTGIVVRF
jgi:hypothetical protein